MNYTREETIRRLEESKRDIPLIYRESVVNYRGKTMDTGEYYTEVAAEWLLDHLELFAQIKTITRGASYRVAGHDGIPMRLDSNRGEELIAMAMKRQGVLPIVGRILDYQTPLKNERDERAGKIDLLAYDGATLRILELKAPESTETMLRCVLEGYTYSKIADRAKLLSDFDLPADTAVEACPFVFRGGEQWDEMQHDRPRLKKLIAALNCRPFYIVKEKENGNVKYSVMEE